MKDSETYVKRDLTKEELSFFNNWTKKNLCPVSKYINFNKGWVVIKSDSNNKPLEVIIIPFFDNKQYYQLIKDRDDYWGFAFDKDKNTIDQAIKHWELINGLKDGAKEAWKDILEFKQIVLEELEPTYHFIRNATKDELAIANKKMGEMLNRSLDKGWIVSLVNRERLIVPNYTSHHNGFTDSWLYIVLTVRGSFEQYATSRSKIVSKRGANSLLLDKAIKHFELINGLKGDAKEAWSDILS